MTEFIAELRGRNELLYHFGLLCMALAMICLILTRTTDINVLGVNAFYKPFKFFLSTTIFVWTMGWYTHYLDRPGIVMAYSLGLIAFFTIEDGYIFLQAAQGKTSHFNLSTPYNRIMWGLMVICSIGISCWTLVLTYYFFTSPLHEIPGYYAWGIRLGLLMFVLFSLEGMTMGARMSHSVGAVDGSAGLPVVNWSTKYGDLRVAHFLGMHALQVIPLVSFFILRNTMTTVLFASVYLILVVTTFVQAWSGRSLSG